MLRQAGTTGAIGIEIALAIAVGYFGGEFLDKKLDTTPWLTYFGLTAGVGAAIKALIRVTRRYKRDIARDEDAATSTTATTADPAKPQDPTKPPPS